MNVLIKVVPQLHGQCWIWGPPPASWPGLRTVQLCSCPAPRLPWSQVGAGPKPNQRAATPSQSSPPPSLLPSVTQMRNHPQPSVSPRPPTDKLGVHIPLGCVCPSSCRSGRFHSSQRPGCTPSLPQGPIWPEAGFWPRAFSPESAHCLLPGTFWNVLRLHRVITRREEGRNFALI